MVFGTEGDIQVELTDSRVGGWGGWGKEGVEVIAVFRGKKYVEANWDVPCAEMILCHLKLSHFPQNITDSLLPSFQH